MPPTFYSSTYPVLYLFAEWVIASLTKASFPLNCEEEFKIHHDDTEQFNSNVKIPLVWWYVTCQRLPAYKQNVWHYSCPGFCGPFIMSFRRRRLHRRHTTAPCCRGCRSRRLCLEPWTPLKYYSAMNKNPCAFILFCLFPQPVCLIWVYRHLCVS